MWTTQPREGARVVHLTIDSDRYTALHLAMSARESPLPSSVDNSSLPSLRVQLTSQ
jgi:hypothetical protein